MKTGRLIGNVIVLVTLSMTLIAATCLAADYEADRTKKVYQTEGLTVTGKKRTPNIEITPKKKHH